MAAGCGLSPVLDCACCPPCAALRACSKSPVAGRRSNQPPWSPAKDGRGGGGILPAFLGRLPFRCNKTTCSWICWLVCSEAYSFYAATSSLSDVLLVSDMDYTKLYRVCQELQTVACTWNLHAWSASMFSLAVGKHLIDFWHLLLRLETSCRSFHKSTCALTCVVEDYVWLACTSGQVDVEHKLNMFSSWCCVCTLIHVILAG